MNLHYVTVSLTIKGVAEALEFYKKALNAEVVSCLKDPAGVVMHADMKLGDTLIYVSEEYPDWKAFSPMTIGGCPSLLSIVEDNVDALFEQAIAAGAMLIQPVKDEFWGTRTGVLLDPYGYRWSISKRIEDLSPEEIQRRVDAMMQQQS